MECTTTFCIYQSHSGQCMEAVHYLPENQLNYKERTYIYASDYQKKTKNKKTTLRQTSIENWTYIMNPVCSVGFSNTSQHIENDQNMQNNLSQDLFASQPI